MSKRAWLFGVAWTITLLGCGSTVPDAGSPASAATQFESSVCKKTQTKDHLARRYHVVIQNEGGLEGLRCVAWKRVGADELKLDLYNFDGACGTTWVGDAALGADGTLELGIDNPSCTIALCGKCLYDWSFDIHATIPGGRAVPIGITVNACKGQQTPAQFYAALGAEDGGMACDFADYGGLLWQASTLGTCGTVSMPCVGSALCGSGSFTSTGTCQAGLVCDSSAAVNEPRCLVPCTTVADCPRADAWSCQTGLCRPNAQSPTILP